MQSGYTHIFNHVGMCTTGGFVHALLPVSKLSFTIFALDMYELGGDL